MREAVEEALSLLDSGAERVAEKQADGTWQVNQWLKKAVLLSFRLNDMEAIAGGPDGAHWWDKVPSKFRDWDANRFREAGFRAVPGSIVRRSAFIGRNVILMPSFVNLGAFAVAAVVGTRHPRQRLADYRGLVAEEPGAGWPLAFAASSK